MVKTDHLALGDPGLMEPPQTIAILDFGGQYSQLIARRVREQHVHSVVCPIDVTPQALARMNCVGLIFSGGPASVYEPGAPRCRPEVIDMGLPILGICYGMQVVCQMLGGEVRGARAREYGRTRLELDTPDGLLTRVPSPTLVWMSHGDVVDGVSGDFVPLARTASCPVAAVKHVSRPIYGLQFHPEVSHTPHGSQIFRNFLFDICGCRGDWQLVDVARAAIDNIRRRVKPGEKIICGLSGGVDSSVTAALCHEAAADQLVCIFVNNGLLRKGEVELVESTFRGHFKIDLHVVDAVDRFVDALAGVTDPQAKRRIIGREFIEVFKAEAQGIPNARYLAQGTLYPDVIESGVSVGGQAAKIKLHHNVGGLPEQLHFELIEPLRDLFKDEVRRVGEQLGLPDDIVWRHPFPGPGLAVRIIGQVTRDRLDLLRDVDEILIDEIRAAGWYNKIGQAFAVLLPVSTVGVMGDERSYADQHIAALRLVESIDFMTADWVRIDQEVLSVISSRIINEVKGINRVV
ncbi:MAG TPA: glutamine-hydrolyzing GMP synthase, partial [Phycisphaerae bacterium]